MTEALALEIATPYLRSNDKVIVASNHGVFINTDEEAVREFASRFTPELQVFVFTKKDDSTSVETDVIEEPQRRKSKKDNV